LQLTVTAQQRIVNQRVNIGTVNQRMGDDADTSVCGLTANVDESLGC